MITFLASPKAFHGESVANQRNAVRSWSRVVPGAEIRLYGNAEGISEFSREMGATWVSEVDTSEEGTPIFSAIAADAARNGRFDLQLYLNCDILLFPGLARAASMICWERFLVVGQRMDLAAGVDVTEILVDPVRRLAELARDDRAALHPAAGSDYFLFRRGIWQGVPPVAIGRAAYDNVLIGFCLARGIPVIDATFAILAVHQYHGYGHVPGGIDQVFRGVEARRNAASLEGGPLVTSTDAGWWLTAKGPLRSACRGDWARAFYLWSHRRTTTRLFAPAIGLFKKAVARTQFSQAQHPDLGEVLASVREFVET